MSSEEENTFPCPSCGRTCQVGDEVCESCGADLTVEDDEENYANDEVTNEYDPTIDRVGYQLEEEEEKKLIKVINKCIENIACECDFYDTEALEDDDNEDLLDDVVDNIADNCDSDEIVGFIDTSSSGSGKTGLVFTKIGIIEKGEDYKLNLPYKKMGDLSMDDGKLVFVNTKGFGSGEQKDKDVYIKDTYYDIDVLMRLCERIVNYLAS